MKWFFLGSHMTALSGSCSWKCKRSPSRRGSSLDFVNPTDCFIQVNDAWPKPRKNEDSVLWETLSDLSPSLLYRSPASWLDLQLCYLLSKIQGMCGSDLIYCAFHDSNTFQKFHPDSQA